VCGIVGILRFDGAPVAPDLVRAMSRQLTHRGPDGDGTWACGPVAFGHRRLAVIDPEGSHQPMATADGRYHLTFNGEILNYRKLRSELAYPFRTDGDTETLLALFAERGPAAVDALEGQFAFAVHDAGTGDLWLARDRMGILPLFWYADAEQFVFASEIKALIPALPRVPDVDPVGLDAYLRTRAVPAPGTLLAGVHKLRPGHVCRVTPDGRIEEQSYWRLPGPDQVMRTMPWEAASRLRTALEHSVERNLVADVPVGTYLSGGIDSSLLTALVARRVDAPVQTFSAGFEQIAPAEDELPYAELVSAHLGTVHHPVMVGPGDFVELWEKLAWYRDAPLSEPADVAVYALARAASEHVKVVLSGEGSDELFAGYPKHRYARVSAMAGLVPSALKEPILDGIDHVLPGERRRLRIALRALAEPDHQGGGQAWFSPFTARERAALLGQSIAAPAPPRERGDALRRMLATDAGSWLADNLLERGDRMTMAASVELRPPFLDREVVELAFRVPSSVKVRHGVGKWVVKQAALGLVPLEIVHRRKAGFRVPLDLWFRGSLRELAWSRLLDPGSFVSSVFDPLVMEAMLADHHEGRRNEDIRIFTLLSLELWHQAFRAKTSTMPTEYSQRSTA
jgi:asparagine synthase (glutamine-hydrolysing)